MCGEVGANTGMQRGHVIRRTSVDRPESATASCPLVSGGFHEEVTQDARGLVQRCLAGDQGAWSWLAQRYWPVSHRVAERVLGQAHSSYAPDVAQEVFVVLLEKLSMWGGTGHASLGAWITSITRRRALNYRRSLRRRYVYCAPATPQIEQFAGRFDGQEVHLGYALKALGAQLSQRQRSVLTDLLEGRSQVEIAGRLQVSQSTVSREIAKIRATWGEYV
jgi:RNA polymerase sigma factor (sigma-70 family)